MNINCNFCGSSDCIRYLKVVDHRLHIPGEWTLYKCTNCGLIFLWPQPDWDELILHYPKQYHGYLQSKSPILNTFRKYGLKKRIKSILEHKKLKGEILDIGCASGEFLEEFRDITGWQVTGLEVVEPAIKIAQEKNIPVITTELLDANLRKNKFDVITLWDVLEHVTDPSAVLSECHRILKTGGLIVIKTPDPSGIEALIFKKYWVGYEAPQHLFNFPRKVLVDYLQQIGFRVEKIKQTGSDFAAPFLSISFFLADHGYNRLANNLVKFSRSIVGRFLLMIIIKPFRLFGIRSSCTYYAIKITG